MVRPRGPVVELVARLPLAALAELPPEAQAAEVVESPLVAVVALGVRYRLVLVE